MDMNTKAIYRPAGKAGEYAEWACNLYVGCSNDCTYCYCKRGVLAHAMGGTTPRLKACFRDEAHAFEVFRKEMEAYLLELRASSLFFTFTSDPMIPQTRALTQRCILHAVSRGVRVQVLTKNADFIADTSFGLLGAVFAGIKDMIAFGFTLTGHDEKEPGASTNAERIEAMRYFHVIGYRTFASIEPVVSVEGSQRMIEKAWEWCDLFKVGLMSGVGKDYYDTGELRRLHGKYAGGGKPFYFKKSFTDRLGLPADDPADIFNLKTT